MTYSGLPADRVFASSRMPRSQELTINGTVGFAYSFKCELGTDYTLFAWFNGSRYVVKLVYPELEKSSRLGHPSHLFPDGTLCLEPTMQGCMSLEEAYAKSVIWANGHSVFRQTGRFPFSHNNLND